jgi:hypothetical protein
MICDLLEDLFEIVCLVLFVTAILLLATAFS